MPLSLKELGMPIKQPCTLTHRAQASDWPATSQQTGTTSHSAREAQDVNVQTPRVTA